MKMTLAVLSALAVGVFAGRLSASDDNERPVLGNSGLPVNCRAYVQASIDGFRTHEFDANSAMSGLERNCGRYGAAWIDKRK